jgi:hypothetical protein
MVKVALISEPLSNLVFQPLPTNLTNGGGIKRRLCPASEQRTDFGNNNKIYKALPKLEIKIYFSYFNQCMEMANLLFVE